MSRSDSSKQEPASGKHTRETDAAADAASGAASQAADQFVSAEERIAELEGQLKMAETEVLKSHAEAENFRKRIQRDWEQQLRYANLPLVRDILDVVDNLKRATEAASSDSGNSSALRSGVEMVVQQLTGTLAKFACKPIEALGQPFDPNYHEAIAQMPSPDVPAGHVLQEVAVGYLLHDRVIRPSQVIVSTGSQ
ncbi:MAG: nucleotide exchange factor GrpE [Aureliella sp.]|jgi:molecular chaperone GrpE